MAAAASVSTWQSMGLIAAAGLVGGLINGLLTDGGFKLPSVTQGIVQPGWIGNCMLGAFSAATLWGLYGPARDAVLFPFGGKSTSATIAVSALAGALLTGAGGARVVTAEIDKRLLRAAGSEAATKGQDRTAATAIATQLPAAAVETVFPERPVMARAPARGRQPRKRASGARKSGSGSQRRRG